MSAHGLLPLEAGSPMQLSSAVSANAIRLEAIVGRLAFILGGSDVFRPAEVFHLCFYLARGVDFALTTNDVPRVACHLPSLIKQVYQHRSDISLQSAITLLLISAKNAYKNGWFHTADADELLSMANELCSSFCMSMSVTTEADTPMDIVSNIVPRFYPKLRFHSLIVSLKAKPGYEILMADFHVPTKLSQEEKIALLVVQTDNLETSSCIVSPPHVSFLVNGKGVERRTNVSVDSGPQFPTDLSKMLKYGTNILQAIGYFTGTYLIAVGYVSKATFSNAPVLKDYVQPALAAADANSEIIEGPSIISLNCPISFRRIRIPVKGHLCKHHQCFDYANFMEMNSRKPSWRCPLCNQYVSCVDIRIDQNMVKILKEVEEGVVDVVISADGSWKARAVHNTSRDQLQNGTPAGQQDGNLGSESNIPINSIAETVDLTMEEDGKNDTAINCRQVEFSKFTISQCNNHSYETSDMKPFKDTQVLPVSQFHADPPFAINAIMDNQLPVSQTGNGISPRVLSSTSASNETLAPMWRDAISVRTCESGLPDILMNTAITNAVSPLLNQESVANLESSQPTFSYQHLSQVSPLGENIQAQHPRFTNSIASSESERPPIPRYVYRAPIAVQALPAQEQLSSSIKRMRIIGPNSSSSMSNGLSAADGHMEMHVVRNSDLSTTQDENHQNHQLFPSRTSQQLASLPETNPASMRVFPTSQPRVAAAHRALQSSSDTQNQMSNHQRLEQNTRFLDNLRSQLESSNAVTPDNLGSSVAGPLRSTAELPIVPNWRPTGRMRGSLTGSAYSAAINHYSVPSTQQPTPVRLPITSSAAVPSTSDQTPALNANNARSHGPVASSRAV